MKRDKEECVYKHVKSDWKIIFILSAGALLQLNHKYGSGNKF